jgi:deoxycytidylate deaminase
MARKQSPTANAPELVVGLVGAVGTDLETIGTALAAKFAQIGYTTETIRLSELLPEVPYFQGKLKHSSLYERYTRFMDAGTELREKTERGDALAMLAVMAIRDKRRQLTGEPTQPLARRVFLLRSLKHPDEVAALRRIYGSNFIVISAYTPEELRFQNLAAKLSASEHVFQTRESYPPAQTLLRRDEAEPGKELGQQVRKTFPLADVFIDTSDPAQLRDSVNRFVESLFGHPFHTPTRDEYGMFHAQAASNRSSALGRQVGAAVTTEDGDIVVVGTNEVPKAGGGLYWPGDDFDRRDYVTGEDINDKLKHRLLADVLRRLKDAKWLSKAKAKSPIDGLVSEILADPSSEIGGAQLMSVIEYGRCVHAEMAAVIEAARRGVSVAGCTLYTTTFPCHECARHIVAAGIRRVVYIDPYPKSLVQELHPDSIALEHAKSDGSRVLFRPFVGIAPRLYLSLFQCSGRKDERGDVVQWKQQGAVPRVAESAVAILVRENAEVEKFRKRMKETSLLQGPKPRAAERSKRRKSLRVRRPRARNRSPSGTRTAPSRRR